MYKYIAQYYRLGLYTAEQVQMFVDAGWITDAQAAEILDNAQ